MIKLSKKWYYSIKTVIYLAENDSFLKISEIANSLEISESLLRRIISELEKSWIVKTVKWRNWWISIWKELKNISIFDILISIWEELWIVECSMWKFCDKSDGCGEKDIYNMLQKWFNWVLKLYTIDKILKNK